MAHCHGDRQTSRDGLPAVRCRLGLAGFCPGPALVSLAAGVPKAMFFVAAMLLGMAIFDLAERRYVA